jgi:post-segregation antitoxin (ccd killing protein)
MNNLKIDLTGKVVVVMKKYYKGDERARRFLCEGGFGCSPSTNGNAIGGTFLIDGERARIEGWQVEKLSDDQSTMIDKTEAAETAGEVKIVRMNISIPSDLRERMKKVDAKFNWSKIAAEAFRNALKEQEA